MIPSTPQIIIESRTGNIVLEPMRMAKLKAFSDVVEPVITQVFTVLEDTENSKQNIVQMITKHYDDLVKVVCVACPAVDTSSGDPIKGLLSNSNEIGTEDRILYLDGNNIKFRVRLSTDRLMTLQHQDAVISSGWNYVKVLRKDGVIKMGLNGIEGLTTIACGSQNVTNNSTRFGVGCMYNTNPDYTSFGPYGFIDEIRLNKQAVVGWDIPLAPFTFKDELHMTNFDVVG